MPRTDVTTVADTLLQIIHDTEPRLRAIEADRAACHAGPGLWSKREILGHLIDSACNNHQRFVRAQNGSLRFPDYEQEHWARCQRYREAPWEQLIDLWVAYNRHLAHVMRGVPADALQVECRLGDKEPVTLGFLIEDYVVHLEHHVAQLDDPDR